MGRRSFRHPVLATASAVLGAALLTLAAVADPSGAQATPVVASGTYTVVARADALTVEADENSLPVIPPEDIAVFGSPASAQTLFTSVGESRAFASAPYPGDFVVSLVPTLAGVGAGDFPALPGYPFIVKSDYPLVKSASQVNGPYGLSATSSADESSADARIGAVNNGSANVFSARGRATSRRDPATGTLTAEAVATFDAFSLGPLLSIGDVKSVARVSVAPGKAPVVDASTDVGSITVLGVKLGLTSEGLVPSLGIPLGIDTSGLESQLAAQGITLHFIKPTKTPTSVSAPGLVISYTHDLPGFQPVTVTLRVGNAVARVDAAATAADGTATPSVELPQVGPTFPTVAPSHALDLAPIPGSILSAPAPAAANPVGRTRTIGYRQLIGDLADPVYLAIIGSVLALLAAGLVLSHLALRPVAVGPPVLRLPDKTRG